MSDEKKSININGTAIEIQTKSKLRKSSKDLQAMADELDVHPFAILLHAAAGDWASLGYESGSRSILTKGGGSIEVDILSPEIRIGAAKEAAQYLHSKKRSIEVSGNQDEPLNLKFEGSIFDLLKLARGES